MTPTCPQCLGSDWRYNKATVHCQTCQVTYHPEDLTTAWARATVNRYKRGMALQLTPAQLAVLACVRLGIDNAKEIGWNLSMSAPGATHHLRHLVDTGWVVAAERSYCGLSLTDKALRAL